ncbi:aminotransferase class V-fold PLP-dependent enzyme [Streptomyces sp. NPDC002039]|uniref:aminotransferase class V-fold PLP-dependent enzyme n=1 Tax=Streptomyces sp. NPDC002039 TaxID=3154660 RepID=UPI003333A72B
MMPGTERQELYRAVLMRAAALAIQYLEGLDTRPVNATATAKDLAGMLGLHLPETGCTPEEAIDVLARAGREGTVASSGPRWFGMVVGGTLPVAIAADWLTSAWDNNGRAYALGPLNAVAELLAAEWLVGLLNLPRGTSVGFTSGCTMAHFTALAAARYRLLSDRGWDVERHGLHAAPPVHVTVGAGRHVTIDLALRYLGFGTAAMTVVPEDEHGRLNPAELRHALRAHHGPKIVCAQAGNVNTGACDQLEQICDIASEADAWVHVDGAFGLWAAASPNLRHHLHGLEAADSWATDAHKWLNVPYDCGIVFVADSHAHQAAMTHTPAGYLSHDGSGPRDPSDWVPEFSRRARAIPLWATLRTLGRSGLADLLDHHCAMARLFATLLAAVPGIKVLNTVVLAQVLVRFDDSDDVTRRTVASVQASGTCWPATTTWHGQTAMRVSVASWATTESDVRRSAAAIRRAWREARRQAPGPHTIRRQRMNDDEAVFHPGSQYSGNGVNLALDTCGDAPKPTSDTIRSVRIGPLVKAVTYDETGRHQVWETDTSDTEGLPLLKVIENTAQIITVYLRDDTGAEDGRYSLTIESFAYGKVTTRSGNPAPAFIATMPKDGPPMTAAFSVRDEQSGQYAATGAIHFIWNPHTESVDVADTTSLPTNISCEPAPTSNATSNGFTLRLRSKHPTDWGFRD